MIKVRADNMGFLENDPVLPVVVPPQPLLEQPHKIVKVDEQRLAAVIKWRISKQQDKLIFNPHPPGWEKMRDPSTYDEFILKPADPKKGSDAVRMNVTQRVLVTESKPGNPDKPTATITLWEKKADPGKEHYIFFTSKRGDIADMGLLDKNLDVEGYDRHAGLKFLKSLGENGAGFTVITMRGYGNNLGKPSEAGFRKDIDVFVQDWLKRSKREGTQVKIKTPYPQGGPKAMLQHTEDANTMPYESRTIVAGLSLGTGNAAILAAKLTESGHPPAMLALLNPFRSMAEVGSHALKHLPKIDPRKYKEGFDLPPSQLSESLQHKFETDKRLAELSKDTQVLIVTSGRDRVIPTENSTSLIKIAKALGLKIYHKIFAEYDHYNIPSDQLAKSLIEGYEQVQAENHARNVADPTLIRQRLETMRDGVQTVPGTPPDPALVAAARKEIREVEVSVGHKVLAAPENRQLRRGPNGGMHFMVAKDKHPDAKGEAKPVSFANAVSSARQEPYYGRAMITARYSEIPREGIKPNGMDTGDRVSFATKSAITCTLGSQPASSYRLATRANGKAAASEQNERS